MGRLLFCLLVSLRRGPARLRCSPHVCGKIRAGDSFVWCGGFCLVLDRFCGRTRRLSQSFDESQAQVGAAAYDCPRIDPFFVATRVQARSTRSRGQSCIRVRKSASTWLKAFRRINFKLARLHKTKRLHFPTGTFTGSRSALVLSATSGTGTTRVFKGLSSSFGTSVVSCGAAQS